MIKFRENPLFFAPGGVKTRGDSMNSGQSNDCSYLDRLRLCKGAEKCRAVFCGIYRHDHRRAAALLNDRRLTFPCLYILREQLTGQRVLRSLNLRNKIAVNIANQIKNSGVSNIDYLSSRQETIHSALRWIVETGSPEQIPEDDYENTLDLAISVLINTYKDIHILPLVTDVIFMRNRSGRNYHDLVWAMFQIHDPRVLKQLAKRIDSSNTQDAVLAAELLNIDETEAFAAIGTGEGRSEAYLRWLEENDPYLYFTGESLQFASNPAFSAVDLERKYLQRGTSSYDKQPIRPISEQENESLAVFRQLSSDEKRALAGYSQKMHENSVAAWKEWLHAPVGQQIMAARSGAEGEV